MLLGQAVCLTFFLFVAYATLRGYGYSKKQSIIIVSVMIIGLVVMKSIEVDCDHNALDSTVEPVPGALAPCCDA